MDAKLAEIKLHADWVERLDVVALPVPATQEMIERFGASRAASSRPTAVIPLDLKKKTAVSTTDAKSDHFTKEIDVQNDYQRELLFYRQAQATLNIGLPRLAQLRIPTKRPEDYFAEMLKSDKHMSKVRESLIERQKSLDLSEKAKKLRHARKYGKEIQQEVLKKRQEDKREMLNQLKQHRKGKETTLDFLNEDKDSMKRTTKGGPSKSPAGGRGKKGNPKRNYKNEKWGFGGQKKRSKYNTKSSAADMGTFKNSKHGHFAPHKKGGGGGAAKKRPGKQRRAQMRK